MALSQKAFDTFRKIAREEAAIVLDDGKEYLVESRLLPLCRSEGVDSLDQLAVKLRFHPPRLTALVVEALTTNETSFFRDAPLFELVKDELLPGLIERRASQRRLNIWCGASSSGQEPVSLGILIRENFPELADWDVKIVATDINEVMIERCKTGVYSQLEVSRGLPAKLLIKYFKKAGVNWKVDDSVLGMLQFRKLNLAQPLPAMGPLDLVFLRNVLIYFDGETKSRILNEVHEQLRPDGSLLLGTAESTLGLCEGFSPQAHASATSYQRAA
ncbi:MAG: CheR family methyltransferase [Planctomycetota bacterium]|jgi:chemotaxis protein methyltransferase CheR